MENMIPKGGIYSAFLLTGHIDEDGVHHSDYTVREMTGDEEDILGGSGSVVGRLNRVIGNCLVSIGTIEDRNELRKIASNMTMVDRLEALIGIRIASLGNVVPYHVTCPQKECRAEFRRFLDLKTLDRRKMPDPTKRVREDVLKSGKRVKWHVMTGADEEWATEKGKTKKNDKPSLMILARVDEIEGNPVNRDRYADAVRMVKRLPLRDRVNIRKIFEEHEGFIDVTIEMECPDCGARFSSELEFDESFFSPSETLDD